MTRPLKKAQPVSQADFERRELTSLRDWLVDPKQEPYPDLVHRKQAGDDLDRATVGKKALEKGSDERDSERYSKALSLLRGEEEFKKRAKQYRYYRTRNAFIATGAGQRNLELQRQDFVALLISRWFRKSRGYKVRSWMEDQDFHEMAEYVMNKSKQNTEEIYEETKQRYYRDYRQGKDDFPPAVVIEWVYRRYLWATRQENRLTRKAMKMFQSLALLAPQIARQIPQARTSSGPWWQMKIISNIPLPNAAVAEKSGLGHHRLLKSRTRHGNPVKEEDNG
jgi:hypothetical protein